MTSLNSLLTAPGPSAAWQGFLLWIALIAAIGPQNALLIKQGLKRRAVGVIVGVCMLSDVIFVLGGVFGMGAVIERAPWLMFGLRWAGVVYLLWFGASCIRDAIRPKALVDSSLVDAPSPAPVKQPALVPTGGAGADQTQAEWVYHCQSGGERQPLRTEQSAPRSIRGPILLALAMCWLNPGAYLDGFVMLGSVANQYGPEKWCFALGSLAATCLWFPVVGYGSAALAKPLSKPAVWRWINIAVALMMAALAYNLAFNL
ncbi:LysE/ArgO family amino acid transporter [Corynebacterium heidelbergense]|uniref:Lysine transporter LysE n=1 Tax=Corynebacterium heidelbergense TaxID=2055947 RepID=A0A364VBB5_9CORY|nr:LysE family transporter [Corynebacterium heidelbergense]RAV33939.1 lysine transporter LysE [Corynebacterium heidelbergense]WCZ36859.1 Arginine exporter protein ArgO [Corynebacterium heidelbergense]